MSEFRFDGQALPEIDASGMAPIFNAGRHDVTITESKVNVKSNTDVQIELKYANKDGQIRQWITWVSDNPDFQTSRNGDVNASQKFLALWAWIAQLPRLSKQSVEFL